MPMSAGELEQMIRTALPDAEVEITDLRGDGDHKMVYDAIEGGMGDELHALALQTGVPDNA